MVCDKHKGIVLPHGDPWWLGHTPPLHYGCVCTLVAIGADEAAGAITEPWRLDAIPSLLPAFGDGLTPDTRPPVVTHTPELIEPK